MALPNLPLEIDLACEMGGGPGRCEDLLHMMCTGEGALWVGEDMHGSAILTPHGVEIFHLFAAEWNQQEAVELVRALQAFAKYHGRTIGTVSGRRGWRRFLRMKGLRFQEI